MTPAGARTSRPSGIELAALVLLLIAAGAFRAYHLGLPTLTGDEWFMLRNHDEGPAWIVRQARVFEPHPLLYYLGFWAWVEAAGRSEWAMRYPSVLFGVLTCAAAWRLTRDAVGPFAAFAAALLTAVNPYQIAQSQNARNYAMVAALATIATAALLAAVERGGQRRWYRYGLLLVLALNTHLNATLVAGAHALWLGARWLLRGQRPEPPAFRVGAAVSVLFLAWIAYALPALTAYQGFYPDRVGVADVLIRTLGTFSFGQIETPRRLLVAAAAAAILLASGWAVWRGTSRGDDRGLLLVATAGLPVVGTALLFLLRPMFEERYLIVAAPACLALIAIGLALLARLHPIVGAAALLAIVGATIPFAERYYPAAVASRPDWRGLAAWMAEREQPGDVALVTGHGVADAYGYYRRARAPLVLAADEQTAPAELRSLLARAPTGAFVLPYWESPPDRLAHDELVARGFADQVRWFRNQRVQYFSLPGEGDPPSRPTGARWSSGAIELESAAVAPAAARAGQPLRVLLNWRASPDAPDLKISLRLVRASGESVVQVDRRPVDEARPFPSFKAGEVVRDGEALWLPDDLAPGRYLVALLLYRPDDAKAVAPAPGAPPAPGSSDLVAVGGIDVAG